MSVIFFSANEYCKEGKRQTLSARDVFDALRAVEFVDFIEPLEKCLEELRQDAGAKKRAKRAGMTDVKAVASSSNGQQQQDTAQQGGSEQETAHVVSKPQDATAATAAATTNTDDADGAKAEVDEAVHGVVEKDNEASAEAFGGVDEVKVAEAGNSDAPRAAAPMEVDGEATIEEQEHEAKQEVDQKGHDGGSENHVEGSEPSADV